MAKTQGEEEGRGTIFFAYLYPDSLVRPLPELMAGVGSGNRGADAERCHQKKKREQTDQEQGWASVTKIAQPTPACTLNALGWNLLPLLPGVLWKCDLVTRRGV